MKEIRIEKLTLNIGAGEAGDKLDKASSLLNAITKKKPIQTKSYKRIPTLGVRPGLAIGTKVTIRRQSEELLKRLFTAVNNTLKSSRFSENTFSFGVPEYIDIPGTKYDANIGIIGLEVAVTLERKGYRIKRRRIQTKKIPKAHSISKEEAIEFVKSKFNIKIEDQNDNK